MKKIFTSIFRPAVLLSLGLALTVGCQQINPLEGVELTVNNNVYKSPILIEFVDANPNSKTLPNDLTVTISGPGKDLVFTDLGGKDFKVAGNLLSVVLGQNANPTESSPVEFTVSVKGPNYVSTNYSIVVTDLESATYEVPLTNLNALPDGVGAVSKTTLLATGETITVPATSSKPEVAKISIAPGTQVKDENGLVINATNVSSTIVQYGTGTEEAANSLPNEGEGNTIKYKDGTTDFGTFLSAGFVDIEMTAGGKNVKSFSTPLDVTLSLNPSYEDPETEAPMNVGDQIPVWSYDKAKDEWTEEGVATIAKDANGNLVANFKVSHLSVWTVAKNYKGKTCSSKTIKIKVNSDVRHGSSKFSAKITYSKNGKARFSKSINNFKISNGASYAIKLRRIPSGYTGRIVVTPVSTSPNTTSRGGSKSFKSCNNAVVIVDVKVKETASDTPTSTTTTDTESDAVKVNLDFTAACISKNISIKPTVWVKLVDDTNTEQLVSVVGGKAIIGMKKGVKYTLTATYNGINFSGEVTINGDKATIVSSTGLNGSFPIDIKTGEVNATIIYPLNNCQ